MKNIPLPVSELSTEPEASFEFSTLELIAILWRGKKRIMLFCLLAIVLGKVKV